MNNYLNEKGFHQALLSFKTMLDEKSLACQAEATTLQFSTKADLLKNTDRKLGVEVYVVDEDQFYYWNGTEYLSRSMGGFLDLTPLQESIEKVATIVG